MSDLSSASQFAFPLAAEEQVLSHLTGLFQPFDDDQFSWRNLSLEDVERPQRTGCEGSAPDLRERYCLSPFDATAESGGGPDFGMGHQFSNYLSQYGPGDLQHPEPACQWQFGGSIGNECQMKQAQHHHYHHQSQPMSEVLGTTASNDLDKSPSGELLCHQLPIANITRIMRKVLPKNAKVAKDAKECVQECVHELIHMVTSEATEQSILQKKQIITGEDVITAFERLGFDLYLEPLKLYLSKCQKLGSEHQQQPESHCNDCPFFASSNSFTGAMSWGPEGVKQEDVKQEGVKEEYLDPEFGMRLN